ncbi:TPA: hypothetical protein BOS_24134 [Bos taurus]|nr:TPA: hypothetical protein BOS_24134 [Bos taurus]
MRRRDDRQDPAPMGCRVVSVWVMDRLLGQRVALSVCVSCRIHVNDNNRGTQNGGGLAPTPGGGGSGGGGNGTSSWRQPRLFSQAAAAPPAGAVAVARGQVLISWLKMFFT